MSIDITGEILLSTLREVGDPVGTGALRKETDFAQNKPILDRLQHFQDRDLVAKSHTEEIPGAAADRQYWKITQAGKEWVDENRDEITKTTARQVETSLQRTLERVDHVEGEMDSLSEKIDSWQSTMNRRSKRITRLDSKIDKETEDAVQLSDEAWNKAQRLETRTDEIESEIRDLRSEVRSMDERIDALESKFESEQKARHDAIRRLGEWTEGEIEKVRKTAHKAQEDAIRAQDRGIIDILTGRR